MQDRCPADHHEVEALVHRALAVRPGRDLARRAEAAGAAWQCAEPLQQRLALERGVFRLLENIPERHVEIVDLAALHQVTRKAQDLAYVHAEPLR